MDRGFSQSHQPPAREAVLRYRAAEYEILREGSFVSCAITAVPIRLEELKYWSVVRQQPYASAEISYAEYLKG